MTFNHFVSIIILQAALLPTAWTLLTVGPENVTVQANQSTFMNCSTTSGGGVKWFHNGVHICTELCFNRYQQQFRVENINSTGSWNLIISFVRPEDTGDYRCEEIGFTPDKRSAQLTVSEIEDKETTYFDITVTTIVKVAGGIILAIVIIMIIVLVVGKYKHKTRKRKKEEKSTELQELVLQASNHDHQMFENEVYLDRPILVKAIKTRIAEVKNSYIRAVSILKEEVFVVTDNRPEIEVYDVINLDLSRRFTIDCLINPLDIKPCPVNNCLYIFDGSYVGEPSKMLKIDSEGHVLADWPMEDSGARLSVASNGNVIVSLSTEKIVEYNMSNGTQVREIEVPALCHAIPLENGQFLISQGHSDKSELHRVRHLLVEDAVTKVKVGTNGAFIINTFGGEKGSNVGDMNVPWYLAVDVNACIMVAERENQRVTLLSSALEFKKILISEADGLHRPLNILVDVPRGRLFVTDFIWERTTGNRVDGRLLVFQIRN